MDQILFLVSLNDLLVHLSSSFHPIIFSNETTHPLDEYNAQVLIFNSNDYTVFLIWSIPKKKMSTNEENTHRVALT